MHLPLRNLVSRASALVALRSSGYEVGHSEVDEETAEPTQCYKVTK